MTELEKVRDGICNQLARLNRPPDSVRILAVSKLQSLEKIKDLYFQGQRSFGENYVQEVLKKQEALKEHSDLEWHFIGHLQSKKLNSIIGRFNLIHSLDSLELAQKISDKSLQSSIKQSVLIQVNLAGEASKEGLSESRLRESWENFISLEGLEIVGLMTMPPWTESPESSRIYFRGLRHLLEDLSARTPDKKKQGLRELSMGTSQDFQVAIEEGATWIRLGSKIFGERPKN